jgi:hypothetical protein
MKQRSLDWVQLFRFFVVVVILGTAFDRIFYLISGAAPYSFGRSAIHVLLTTGLAWILGCALVGLPYRERKQDVTN